MVKASNLKYFLWGLLIFLMLFIGFNYNVKADDILETYDCGFYLRLDNSKTVVENGNNQYSPTLYTSRVGGTVNVCPTYDNSISESDEGYQAVLDTIVEYPSKELLSQELSKIDNGSLVGKTVAYHWYVLKDTNASSDKINLHIDGYVYIVEDETEIPNGDEVIEIPTPTPIQPTEPTEEPIIEDSEVEEVEEIVEPIIVDTEIVDNDIKTTPQPTNSEIVELVDEEVPLSSGKAVNSPKTGDVSVLGIVLWMFLFVLGFQVVLLVIINKLDKE